jgi:hypothetical protein
MKAWILTAALVLTPLTASLAADPSGARAPGRSALPAVQRPVGTLAIDGVRGERADGLIDVLSVVGACGAEPAGAKAAASPRDAASGLPTGKRQHKPFVITKSVDKASPLLAQAAASGKKLTRVRVKDQYMTYELKEVLVTSYRSGGGSDKVPIESFSLDFSSCTRK